MLEYFEIFVATAVSAVPPVEKGRRNVASDDTCLNPSPPLRTSKLHGLQPLVVRQWYIAYGRKSRPQLIINLIFNNNINNNN